MKVLCINAANTNLLQEGTVYDAIPDPDLSVNYLISGGTLKENHCDASSWSKHRFEVVKGEAKESGIAVTSRFEADWCQTWTAKEAEKQLSHQDALAFITDGAEGKHKPFKFAGPGWYIQGEDTMLVMADRVVPTKDGLEATYRFYVYNGRDPRALFEGLAHWVVREDAR